MVGGTSVPPRSVGANPPDQRGAERGGRPSVPAAGVNCASTLARRSGGRVDKQLNRKSLAYGVPGIALQFGGSYLPPLMGFDVEDPPIAVTAAMWMAILAGTALLIVGLGLYAAAKGHSRWAGLLGLLSIVGIIVLAVLPDKRK